MNNCHWVRISNQVTLNLYLYKDLFKEPISQKDPGLGDTNLLD